MFHTLDLLAAVRDRRAPGFLKTIHSKGPQTPFDSMAREPRQQCAGPDVHFFLKNLMIIKPHVAGVTTSVKQKMKLRLREMK